MKMKQYWPQHKIFFIATLALFPDKLKGHDVNQWFYKPYFISKNPDFVELELNEYQKAGYITYEKPSVLYKISDINTLKATTDLTEYLKEWQSNELLSLPANKPPDAAYQQSLLQNAIVKAHSNNQKEPRITLQDVYGEPGSYTYVPPFWELVLSSQLLDKKVKIQYMDYDRREDGLYEDSVEPVVDLQIVDKKLKQSAMSYTILPATNAKTTTHSARIVLSEDGLVQIMLDDGINYPVKKLRYDGAPYNFLRHILDNPGRSIDITEIHDKVKGCKAKKDMTEVVRQCGFDETLKVGFFTGTAKEKVRLKQHIILSAAQLDLLKNSNRKQS